MSLMFVSMLFGQLTEIYDIQFTQDQGSDCFPSPYENQQNITIRGVVTAVENNGTYHTFFVQDADSSSAWNGIYVFNNSLQPLIGNYVSATGTVTEYYGITELGYLTASNVLIANYPLPAPVVLLTGDLASECNWESEKYESVLVEFQNVTVTQSTDSYGEWVIDDGSGPVIIDDFFYDCDTQIGDEILTIRGIVKYSYDEFKLNPRDAADIIFAGAPTIGNVEISPALPSENSDITVCANIVDDGFFSANVQFSTDGEIWNEIPMQNVTGDKYEAIIASNFDVNTNVLMQIIAADDDGMEAIYPEDAPLEVWIYPYPYPISVLHQNNEDGIPLLLDDVVRVCGIVTADQFGNPKYIQDATGGIAIYDNSFLANLGDEVCLDATVVQYLGLTELEEVANVETISNGNVVEPQIIEINDLLSEGMYGIENFEGELIRVNNIVTDAEVWSGNQAYTISDGTGSVGIYVDSDTNLPENLAPINAFDLIGIVGQYDPVSPFTTGYQILPRSLDDILSSSGPVITANPQVMDFLDNGMVIYWETDVPTTARINYGQTINYEEGMIEISESETIHTATISGIASATMYHLEVIAISETGETSSGDCAFLTSSSGSSGEISVFFNKDVNHDYALDADWAQGNIDLVSRLIERMNAAQFSIDVTAYSWSIGSVTDALIEAKNRGVSVRFIYDSEHNQDEVAYIEQAGIPVITNADGSGSVSGIMHNKFIIFDARNAQSEADDYLWTGSMNFTSTGTNTNTQNVVLIQDAALAQIYTMEFNEMWGSDTEIPNLDLARFGENKLDNTPHFMKVGEHWIDVYFSPSDAVTNKITNLIQTADESLLFCIYSFTRDEIASAMQNEFDNGITVRGIFDSSLGTGEEYSGMSNWADVHLDSEYGVLHHKYLIVDAFGENPAVLTGSHNWSSSAETVNDENTLIIWNENITGQFLQEFAARYENSAGVVLPVPEVGCTLGDVNQDNILNVLDIIMMINIILEQNLEPTDWELCAADANEDSMINVLDVVTVLYWVME